MSGLGCILSIVAGCFLLIGLIPLLGWLNWLTTLPISLLAAIFCYQRMQAAPDDAMARIGLIVSVLIFAVGAFRLALGGGIL
jgi:hypothetical protein